MRCSAWADVACQFSLVVEAVLFGTRGSVRELRAVSGVWWVEVPFNEYFGSRISQIATAEVDPSWTAAGPVVVEKFNGEPPPSPVRASCQPGGRWIIQPAAEHPANDVDIEIEREGPRVDEALLADRSTRVPP
jgi:hypothetical protein